MKPHAVLESKWQVSLQQGLRWIWVIYSSLPPSLRFSPFSHPISITWKPSSCIGVHPGSLPGIHFEGLVYMAWRLAPVPGILLWIFMSAPGRVISKKAAHAEYIPKSECFSLVWWSFNQTNVGGRGEKLFCNSGEYLWDRNCTLTSSAEVREPTTPSHSQPLPGPPTLGK